MKKNRLYLLAGFLGLIITTLTVSSMVSADELTGKFRGGDADSARFEEMQAQHEAMQEVIANGNYDAWKELVDSRPRITDVVTEENFAQFVQMHQLMQDGDREGAQAIAEELDLPDRGQGFGKGSRMGHGMGKGNCPFSE